MILVSPSREESSYHDVCTKISALVMSTPADCFHVVVSVLFNILRKTPHTSRKQGDGIYLFDHSFIYSSSYLFIHFSFICAFTYWSEGRIVRFGVGHRKPTPDNGNKCRKKLPKTVKISSRLCPLVGGKERAARGPSPHFLPFRVIVSAFCSQGWVVQRAIRLSQDRWNSSRFLSQQTAWIHKNKPGPFV